MRIVCRIPKCSRDERREQWSDLHQQANNGTTHDEGDDVFVCMRVGPCEQFLSETVNQISHKMRIFAGHITLRAMV